MRIFHEGSKLRGTGPKLHEWPHQTPQTSPQYCTEGFKGRGLVAEMREPLEIAMEKIAVKPEDKMF